jgi:hypothetical protein
MSNIRIAGHQLDKQSTITGIGGLALLVVGLIVHQTWIEFLGIAMIMIRIRGQERGLWVGSCGMALTGFGLVFSEPWRVVIGCTFILAGILLWRVGRVRRV